MSYRGKFFIVMVSVAISLYAVFGGILKNFEPIAWLPATFRFPSRPSYTANLKPIRRHQSRQEKR